MQERFSWGPPRPVFAHRRDAPVVAIVRNSIMIDFIAVKINKKLMTLNCKTEGTQYDCSFLL